MGVLPAAWRSDLRSRVRLLGCEFRFDTIFALLSHQKRSSVTCRGWYHATVNCRQSVAVASQIQDNGAVIKGGFIEVCAGCFSQWSELTRVVVGQTFTNGMTRLNSDKSDTAQQGATVLR